MLYVPKYVIIDELYAEHWLFIYPDKEVLYVPTHVNIYELYAEHWLTLYADKDVLYDVNTFTTIVYKI